MIEALVNSVIVVAIGELGDKTQFLALLLAARYRRRAAVIAGILVATCVMMTVTAVIGSAIGQALPRSFLRWGVGAAFIAIAIWTAFERDESVEETAPTSGRGAFFASMTGFMLAELGDKSQIATLTLAAQYQSFAPVAIGSIIGEMIAIVPAVLLGHGTGVIVPLHWIRRIAVVVFAGFGIAVLAGFGLS